MKLSDTFPLLMAATLFCSHGANSQDLNIFQEVAQPKSLTRSSPENNQSEAPKPVFTLRGTSKFGDKYQSSLVARNGNIVSVNWSNGNVSEIEGYQGYSIINIESRAVSVRLPTGESCIESIVQGVSCSSGGDVSILSLVNDEPLSATSNIDQMTSIESRRGMEPGNRPAYIPGRENRRVRETVAEEFDNEMQEAMISNIPEGMQLIRTSTGFQMTPK